MSPSKKPKKKTAASSKPVARKRATLRDLPAKKGPKGGTVASTLPDLSSAARAGSVQAPLIAYTTMIPGPGGMLIP